MSSPEMPGAVTSEKQLTDIESDLAQQERTVESLEKLEAAETGKSSVSPERIKAMREAVDEKRKHFQEFSQEKIDPRIHELELENQFFRSTEQIKKESAEIELVLRALNRYRDDPDVASAYEATHERMLNLRDRYEDLERSIPADSTVRRTTSADEEQIRDTFHRMLQMDEEPKPMQGPEKMPLELYDNQAREIMEEVVSLQDAFENGEAQGMFKANTLLLHDELDAAQERIQNLDMQAQDPTKSKERRVLIKLIEELRVKYPYEEPEKEKQPEMLTPGMYDVQVGEVMAEIISLQDAFEYSYMKKPSKAKMLMLQDGLDAAQERIQSLDERTENPAQSQERQVAIAMVQKLRDRYLRYIYPSYLKNFESPNAPPVPPQGELSTVRGIRKSVVASYAAMQHRLTVDQRREIRTRIAKMTSLVRSAEEKRLAGVSTAVQSNISHALEHSPAVAHAAVSKKSAKATLAAAFRLK